MKPDFKEVSSEEKKEKMKEMTSLPEVAWKLLTVEKNSRVRLGNGTE